MQYVKIWYKDGIDNTYWMQDQDYSETFGYGAWVSSGLLKCVLDGLVKVVA